MQLMGGRMMGGMGMQHGADSTTAEPEPRRQLMENRVAMLQMMMEQVMPQMQMHSSPKR